MRSQVTILAFVLLGLIAGASAQTSAPTLEGVEAQLKAKREQAARDAAALRQKQADAARQAEAKRKADVSARDAQSKRMAEQTARAAEAKRQAATERGTLVLQSDADCTLVIDGVSQGTLRAGNVRSLEVVPGEQLIACTSSVDPSKSLEATETVLAGQKQVVKLALAALLVPPKSESTAGSVFRAQLKDGGEGPEMVVVPAGSFWMGSPDSEADRTTDEGPLRQVQLKSFAMGKYEVTVAQFRSFVNATGYRTDAEQNVEVPGVDGSEAGCFGFDGQEFAYVAGSSWRAPSFGAAAEKPADTHPAVCLSWNDAQAYVGWLSQQTGKRYRLPSEAQQEYALRARVNASASANTRFAWGEDADSACTHGNVLDQSAAKMFSGGVNCSDGFVFTSPVGRFQANALGLYDTVGNAWEWGEDCVNASYGGAPSDGSAWQSGDCGRRVLRGGGWDFYPVILRAASRDWIARAIRYPNLGFRLIQDL